MSNSVPNYVRAEALEVAPVGSRVTCTPAPMDTDEDFLVLLPERGASTVLGLLIDDGYVIDGSAITDGVNRRPLEEIFQSYSRRHVNLIVTRNRTFFQRFMAATDIAKRFNIMQKTDRIALFQAVLYGNRCDPPPLMDIYQE